MIETTVWESTEMFAERIIMVFKMIKDSSSSVVDKNSSTCFTNSAIQPLTAGDTRLYVGYIHNCLLSHVHIKLSDKKYFNQQFIISGFSNTISTN
jgi:hypothetical protein